MVTTESTAAPSKPSRPKPEKSDDGRVYATTRHPTIAAVIAGNYRYADIDQAKRQLAILRDHFVLSRHQTEEAGEHGIILWIKGYLITPEEKKDGYTGNYAVIFPVLRPNGKYTLIASKVESELKFHPQRQRPTHKHPNWGHPILRSVKKKRIHDTVEAAQEELARLHEEFPEVTIPLTNKLYLIVYSRQDNPPAQKYVLEVKVGEKGGFYIDATKNEFQGKADIAVMPEEQAAMDGRDKKAPVASDEGKPAPGKFASMVELRRKKKRKKPGRKELPKIKPLDAE